MLIDTYGRIAGDLRVSLTDRCNLRCTYCMPAEGLRWLARPDLLTDDEVARLIRIAVTKLGVHEVRFTGGEPLLRPGLVGIIKRCAALAPRPRLSLTTNGLGLERTATAERWLVDGGPARGGVIASVTRSFCRACDRTRLTTDGQVRACRFAREESDLRAPLRSGVPDEEIAGLWKRAM